MTITKNALVSGVLLIMSVPQASSEPTATTTIVKPHSLYDPAPYGYSHAVVTADVGGLAYIAGQGGADSSGQLEPDFESQVAQAYTNLSAALAASGARTDQVTKINTYVVDYDQAMLEVMTKYVVRTFGDHLPAQTLVPVPRLAIDGMLFEVDAIAVLDN